MRFQRLAYTASRPAFTNDFDHSSEPSREGSVQIIESHRHTFSVPSSDDGADTEDEEEEVQIASSVQGDEEEVSAATTPDRQAVGKPGRATEGEAQGFKTGPAPGDTCGLNLKGPSVRDLLTKTANDGTSQENPINLEGACTNIIDVDTESEDDGPEVIPFYETSKTDQPNRSRVWDEPQVAPQIPAMKVPTGTTVTEKPSDRDAETQRHCLVSESQAKVASEDETGGHESRNAVAESCAGATDGFESEDDDVFDFEHEFFGDEDLEPFPEPAVLHAGIPNSSKPKVTFQLGSDKPYHTTLTPPFDEFRPTRLGHLSVSDAIDVSQSAEPSSAWAQRAPSPSDAALARKASDPKALFGRDTFDNFTVPQWSAATKASHTHSTEHALDNAASREDQIGAYWPELQSPEPRSYDQGPFSQPKVVVPAPRSPKSDNVKNPFKKATVTWADPHEESDEMVIMSADPFGRTAKQASKITIPSLVENYSAENSRSLKRKHGGTNWSDDVEVVTKALKPSSPVTSASGLKGNFVEANPVSSSCSFDKEFMGARLRSQVEATDHVWPCGEESTTQRQMGLVDQESPLPEAQPRENIFQIPTASISQDSTAEPALGSVSTTTSVQDDGTQGPARKKVRTSSSGTGGIGKFVMGVGFGLLGAAAAFVATIPNSVYEEALREFGNAA